MPSTTSLPTEVGAFTRDGLDELCAFFDAHGFAVLRGLWDEERLGAVEAECMAAQAALVAGTLAERHGNTVLIDDPGSTGGPGGPVAFANYVQYVTEVAPAARAVVLHPVVLELMSRWVPGGHLQESSRFGVVYQDARPGEQSGYARIGWHSDAQSGPTLHVWPSVAFTIHVDATSPRNGFLRIVPGSHLGGTGDMPPGFEHVTGEMAVYCERGDVLLHHSDLWHSAARATDDGEGAVRRHVRGGWYGGEHLAPNHGLGDFVKNARR